MTLRSQTLELITNLSLLTLPDLANGAMLPTPNLAGAHSPAGAPHPNPAGARQANGAMFGLLRTQARGCYLGLQWIRGLVSGVSGLTGPSGLALSPTT